jgi:hypothetical protein
MTSVLRTNKWQNAAGTTRGAVINTYHTISTAQQSIAQGGSGENRGNQYFDLSNMSITLTPVSSASRFLIMGRVHLSGATSDNYNCHIRINRNGSEIGSGVTGSYSWAAHSQLRIHSGAGGMGFLPFHFMDSPATTSALTYKIQGLQTNYGMTLYLNRWPEVGWQSANASTFTIMEIQE